MPKYGIGVTVSQSYFGYIEAENLDEAVSLGHTMPLEEIKANAVESNDNRVVDTITDSIDSATDLESVERYIAQDSF